MEPQRRTSLNITLISPANAGLSDTDKAAAADFAGI